MTKIYDGAGIYTVSFGCSGKTIELTEDEMDEIAQESPTYQEMEEDYKRDKTELDSILLDIENQGEYIRKLEDVPNRLDAIKVRRADQKIYDQVIKDIEDTLQELDSLGKYI